jgi:uncharacterized protein YodC (DUF2158 family)
MMARDFEKMTTEQKQAEGMTVGKIDLHRSPFVVGDRSPFAVGDTVRLKSGGPAMTVFAIVGGGSSAVLCCWFEGLNLKEGRWPHECFVDLGPEKFVYVCPECKGTGKVTIAGIVGSCHTCNKLAELARNYQVPVRAGV